MAGGLETELNNLGLDKYVQGCRDAGFYDWQSLTQMTELDMAALNMPLGCRRRLQREIARQYSWPDYEPLPTTSELNRHMPASTVWSRPQNDRPTNGCSEPSFSKQSSSIHPSKCARNGAPNATNALQQPSTWTLGLQELEMEDATTGQI